MLEASTGKNISDKHHAYAELAAQYWVRHNSPSRYVGFCHYRRYFSFDTKGLPPSDMLHANSKDILNDLSSQNQRIICEQLLAEFDIIVPRHTFCPNGIKDQALSFGTPEQVWELFERAVEIAAPSLGQFKNRLVLSQHAHFFNMYVMRWVDFCEYFDGLYGVLETLRHELMGGEFEKYATDRWPGILAERYFNLWLLSRGLSAIQVPIVRIPD